MSALLAQAVDLSSSNTTLVIVVGVIAILAVAIAMVFRSQVLAANDGTENMKTIAAAVQEGASAYLNRQFRTLSIFAVVAFGAILTPEVLGLPRLGAVAEVAWTPPERRDWEDFRQRVAAESRLWRTFHRTPQVLWP